MDEEILTSMGLLSCNEEDEDFNDDDAWVMEGEDMTFSLMRMMICKFVN